MNKTPRVHEQFGIAGGVKPMRKLVITIVVVTAALVGCSQIKKVTDVVSQDIALEDQEMLLEKYASSYAWTRGMLEDLSEREQPGQAKKQIVPRDSKVEIVGLNFAYNGAVTVDDIRSRRKRRIVHGLDIESPLTVEKIEARLDEIFWFDDPTTRHVAYIRSWGKKTARAVVNHEVFIGMHREAALESWGMPTKVNTNEIGGNKEEQWVYKQPTRSKYVYIINDIVSKWEE